MSVKHFATQPPVQDSAVATRQPRLGLLERIEQCNVPAALRGAPLLLIAAGLMSLAFLGFNGLGAA